MAPDRAQLILVIIMVCSEEDSGKNCVIYSNLDTIIASTNCLPISPFVKKLCTFFINNNNGRENQNLRPWFNSKSCALGRRSSSLLNSKALFSESGKCQKKNDISVPVSLRSSWRWWGLQTYYFERPNKMPRFKVHLLFPYKKKRYTILSKLHRIELIFVLYFYGVGTGYTNSSRNAGWGAFNSCRWQVHLAPRYLSSNCCILHLSYVLSREVVHGVLGKVMSLLLSH
jgi:hypothetical protein